VSLELDEHRLYLSDPVRVESFRRALAEVVTPRDVVADLGAGTGILGLMACAAGAGHVYAIESGAMAGLARAIVAANGLEGRMTVLREHSTLVTLPRPATVVVTDTIGNFGFNGGLFEYLADARRRLLAPGGRTIPAWVELWTSPVEHEELRQHVTFWEGAPAGFDYSPAVEIAKSTGYPIHVEATQLLAPGAMTIRVDPPTATDPIGGTATFTVTRTGLVDGVAGWFRAGLSPSVVLTNEPGHAGRISRRPAVLPISPPCAVDAGDRIEIRLRILAPHLIVAWRVTAISPGGTTRWQKRGSTFSGMLMSREDTARTRPDWTPALTPRGRARQTVLQLCDGKRPLAEIERELLARHDDVVQSPEAAAEFVAEVVTRYAV
jgi:hypothetical protein